MSNIDYMYSGKQKSVSLGTIVSDLEIDGVNELACIIRHKLCDNPCRWARVILERHLVESLIENDDHLIHKDIASIELQDVIKMYTFE